jgi:hypothetical protein
VAQASGRDPEIVGSDGLALSSEVCPQSGMHSGSGNLDGKEGEGSENSFHEGRSSSPNSPFPRTMDSVKKFAGGGYREKEPLALPALHLLLEIDSAPLTMGFPTGTAQEPPIPPSASAG